MKIKIKKLNELAKIPKYAKQGDAGMDLTVTSITKLKAGYVKYGFGVALEIPQGYVGLVFPRSSIYKTDLILSNSVGVIDSGYRGEISAVMTASNFQQAYKIGERACQIVIMPYPKIEFEQVQELDSSERGENGYGSSGK